MYVPRTLCPWSSALTSLRGPTADEQTLAPSWTPLGLSGLRGVRGLGCADGCQCGGSCGGGMGRGMRGGCGMGLFDTPWDLSTWGFAEWGIAALAGYALFSMFYTSSRASRAISRSSSARRTRRSKQAELKSRRYKLESELARA